MPEKFVHQLKQAERNYNLIKNVHGYTYISKSMVDKINTRIRNVYPDQSVNVHLLYRSQNGKCLCGKRLEEIDRLMIDHDHDSGLIRGLLCGLCNSMLGFARDSIETLQNAISYLDIYKKLEINEPLEIKSLPLCPYCSTGRLVERTRKRDGNKFLGCNRYPRCKFATNLTNEAD